MHRNNLQLSGLVVFLAMIACALPGQTIQPAPTPNANSIETAVLGTAQAAAGQTEQASPVTATTTPVPTEALTPTPKISISGTSLLVREDQSTLFTDYKAGIQLIIPTGWMSLRLDEEEFLQAFDSQVVLQNPVIMKRLTVIRDLDPVYFRLNAIDIRPGHILDGYISDIDVIFQPGDVRRLEDWEQAERDRYHPQAGFKFISASYPQIANGMRVLVIEQSWSDDDGSSYYRGVFFSLPSGTIVLDFYTNNDFKDTVLPDLEQVINSLTLID